MPESIETLLADPRFIRWVIQGDDHSHWETWMAGAPGRPALVEEARTLLRSLAIRESALSQEEIEGRVEAILRRLRDDAPDRAAAAGEAGRLIRLRRGWAGAAIVAAAIVAAAILVAAFWLARRPRPAASTADDGFATVSTGESRRSVTLPDGSQVVLYPTSFIRYATHPGAAVSVYLTGKAEFSVTVAPNRPFRVYTSDLVTTVLGTRFVVSGDKVTVITGKVSVSRNAGPDSVLTGVQVKPNQALVYEPLKRDFQKVLVDTPVAVRPPATPDFRYDNAPVTEVLEQLKATYDLDIVYDRDVLQHCRISADLSDESIYRKLDLICQALDARYTVTDGTVRIDARPCE